MNRSSDSLASVAGSRRAGLRGAALAVGAALAFVCGPPAGAQGPEFRVNTYTTGDQVASAVAMDGDGAFVVVWESDGQDGSAEGIYAQRYSAAGEAVGMEFRVSMTTFGNQFGPRVAMTPDGGFIVVWQSYTNGGSGTGIFARRYAAEGEPLGPEFPVPTAFLFEARHPSIAVDAAGGFAVVWASLAGGDGWNIYAQRFTAAGEKLGPEFRVTPGEGEEWRANVLMSGDGRFVVVWDDMSGTDDVYARRYDASGDAIGDPFRVNTSTEGAQRFSSAAMDAQGAFVVVWASGVPNDIYVRRYSASGEAQGPEFRANAHTQGNQVSPRVAMGADGGFVVVWDGEGTSEGHGVFGQAFDATGAPMGGEFRANVETENVQRVPSLAMNTGGDIIVAWESGGIGGLPQDGSGFGIYARRLSMATVPVEPGAMAGFSLTVVPSPVAGAGRIQYEVPATGSTRLAVYDVLGRAVTVLHDGAAAAGVHEAALDASALAPGVYVVRLEAGGDVLARTLTVAR